MHAWMDGPGRLRWTVGRTGLTRPHPPIHPSVHRQVSYFLGTYGPSITLETACSSSLVAIAMAVASLQQGDCDTALVTGLNYLYEKDFHLALQVRTLALPCLSCAHHINERTHAASH